MGLDEEGRTAVLGEAKWYLQAFIYQELERYLEHVRALGNRVRPDTLHLLLSRSGFTDDVQRWATTHHVRLLTPANMLDRFSASS